MGVTDDVDSDSWFGRPIAQFLEAAGWDARDVWESDQEEGGAEGAGHCRLWECRLFPLYSGDGDGEADAHAVRRAAVEAYSDPACPAHRPSLDRLRALPRVSLAHLLATALPHPELLWRDNLGTPPPPPRLTPGNIRCVVDISSVARHTTHTPPPPPTTKNNIQKF